MGLVSALASLFFIVLLVGDLLSQRTALAPAQMISEMQAEVAQFTEASPDTPGALDAAEAVQAPALEAAPGAAPMGEAPLTAFLATEAPQSTLPPPPAAKVMALQPTPSETVVPPVGELLEAIPPSSGQTQNFAAPATGEQESGEQSSERAISSATTPEIFGLNQNYWHGMEILAAILAVTTGIVWWLRRRRF
jgi:hypothetical protein